MALEHRFESIAHLADRRPLPRRLDTGRQQIAVADRRVLSQRSERSFGRFVVALRARLLEAPDLLLPHIGVVDVEHVDHLGVGDLVLVHANDDIFEAVDTGLLASRSFFDA